MDRLLDRWAATRVADTSTIGVGGVCPRALPVRRPDELAEVAARLAGGSGEPVLVLGGCSNVVVSDAGTARPVVVFAGTGAADGVTVAGAGGRAGANGRVTGGSPGTVEVVVDGSVAWDDLVRETVARGLAGLEFLSGIPGTVGAAPVQNIGAYGRAVGDRLAWVDAVDLATGERQRWTREDCALGYRTSRFREHLDRWAILRIGLHLEPDAPVPLDRVDYRDLRAVVEREGAGALASAAARRELVLGVRRRKSMVVDRRDPLSRSLGSFFVSPRVDRKVAEDLVERVHGPGAAASLLHWYSDGGDERVKVPAAITLLAAGFRNGDQWGAVRLSDRHVLALVNAGGATAENVWLVAQHIRATVADRCGVDLECEPRFIGEFPPYDAADFARRYEHVPGQAEAPSWVKATLDQGRPAP